MNTAANQSTGTAAPRPRSTEELDTENSVTDNKEQRISFQVGHETFVIPVSPVQEVMEYQQPVPVPGAPEGVEGVLNVRGEIVTALSGHELLDQASNTPREDWRMIIMHSPEGMVALCVDRVGEIISFAANEAEWNSQQSSSELFEGTLKQGDQLFILVNFEQFRHPSRADHDNLDT